ncbi:putative quinol monooxygenase [Oerskovia turbata]|uniref:putative quinol monooxygenase n=1 Tax=Oerskovia turbata TaxID=1713 RepID=UPI0004BF8BE9|nr:putative quinol monooxygenase [Oerskovia turbata]
MRVLVPCSVDERHQPRALEVYRELVDATRQEAGCLSYELLQRMDDATRFVLVEEWKSQDDLDAHTRTEHFVRLVAELEQLEKAAPAELYRRVL